ncbi:MAG: autotransporter-associated beta strand repeat-containing protein [Verrucomicrobiota bacterium]
MKPRNPLNHFGATVIFLIVSANAADIVKDNNTNALNTGAAWQGGVVPGPGGVGLWNSTVTGYNVSALGGDLSWQGIRIANVGGAANPSLATAGIQITNASSANTLTLGTAGIDMSAATQALLIQTKIALSGSQTWNIANANKNGAPFAGSGINAGLSEDLMLIAQANATLDLGGYSLGTSGLGSIGVSSGYTLSNGTLNLGNPTTWIQSGSNRTTALAATLTANVGVNSLLRLRANSGSGGVGINSAAPVTVSGSGSKLQLESNNSSASLTQSGNLTLGNGSTLEAMVSNAGAFIISAPTIATSGSNTWLVSGGNAGHANGVAISGNLTGNGAIAYQNTASGANGQVRLSGNNSGFTGSITINGTSGNRNLRLASATSGSAAATWSVAAGNTLQVDGVAVNLGTLNGAGGVTNSHVTNAAPLAIGAGTFTGVISNGAGTGGLALTKTGAATLSLTGANTYSGTTTVNGGTLSTTSAQTGGGAVTVSDTATFGVTQITGSDTLNVSTLTLGSAGGSTLELTPATEPSAPLLTAGVFNINGPTNLRVKGLTVAGTTLVAYTSIGGSSGSAGLSLVMPFRINGSFTNTGSAIVLSTVTDETPKWRIGNGIWDVNTTGNWKTASSSTTTNFLQGGPGATDSVIFDDTSSGTSPITVTLNSAVSPVSITVDGVKNYAITGTGTIAGTAHIAKNGPATLTLATANSFSGGVQLNGGTLNVNHASALGTGTLTIASGTTLDNTSGSAIISASAVPQAWNSGFAFTGSGNLDLGLGAVTMSADCTITVSASTLSVGGLSGSGLGLTKDGAGTLDIGAGSYTGATVVNGGTLRARAAGAFGSTASVTLADAAGVALDLNGFNQTINSLGGGGTSGGNILLGAGILTTGAATDATLGGTFSGSGGLVKNGTGTLTLSGDASGHTGTLTVNGGVLSVGDVTDNLANSAALSLANGAVLEGNGTITRSVGSGQLVVSSNGGFAARSGDLTLNFFGDARAINFSSGGNVFGGNFVFGSASADAKVILVNPIGINNYNGSRTVTVNPGLGGDAVEFAGPVMGGGAGGISNLIKLGAGRLILSAANTFTGDTKVGAGVIVLANDLALQGSALDTSGPGTFEFSAITSPTLGGLNGSVNLAMAVTAGLDAVTTLTLNTVNTDATLSGNSKPLHTYSGVLADGLAALHLVKTGAGTQTLSGTNTFTGDTTVLAGTLAVSASALPDTGRLFITAGKVAATGTEVVGMLFINGVQQAAGTFGASGSGASHIDDVHFSGTAGMVQVTTGGGFATWAVTHSIAVDPAGDSDHDGIGNLVEYALGLNPAAADTAGTFDGSVLSFNKNAAAVANGDVTYAIEQSHDLGLTDPWTTAAAADAGLTISYTLPTSGPAIFARLKVTLIGP